MRPPRRYRPAPPQLLQLQRLQRLPPPWATWGRAWWGRGPARGRGRGCCRGPPLRRTTSPFCSSSGAAPWRRPRLHLQVLVRAFQDGLRQQRVRKIVCCWARMRERLAYRYSGRLRAVLGPQTIDTTRNPSKTGQATLLGHDVLTKELHHRICAPTWSRPCCGCCRLLRAVGRSSCCCRRCCLLGSPLRSPPLLPPLLVRQTVLINLRKAIGRQGCFLFCLRLCLTGVPVLARGGCSRGGGRGRGGLRCALLLLPGTLSRGTF